jgi:hypothetical protein
MRAFRLFAAAAVATIACAEARAGNQLLNPGFDTPSGLGPTSFTEQSPPGQPSVALDRSVWNNSLATTTSDLVPSTDPSGGGSAGHIVTGGPENGFYQFVADNSVDFVSVDVYLLSGTFELGLGRGGAYEASATTSVLDR